MLISLCIPVMDRTGDLKRTLPTTVAAANASPPVELSVLDYGSRDGEAVIECIELAPALGPWNVFASARRSAEYYHKAHAWNLAFRLATGDYRVLLGADAILNEQYIVEIRKLIADGSIWMRGRHYKGIVCVQREEFIAAGGYDERFEYSGEDKELDERLRRRGAKFGLVPDGLVKTIRTPNALKFANARGNPTKAQAIAHGERLRKENEAAGLLVANQGKEWGAW